MAFDKSAAKLSSSVLKMKFMKKSKEKSEMEAEEEKRKILFESEAFIKGGDACIMEPSHVPILQLTYGRMSFKGMNPEIEKLMQENESKDLGKLRRMDGVSDKEMAERYSTLMGTMNKKFTTKRKWAAENNNADKDDDEVLCYTPPNVTDAKKDKRPKFRKPRD